MKPTTKTTESGHAAHFHRILSPPAPFPAETNSEPIWSSRRWPASWISVVKKPVTPLVMGFRLKLDLPQKLEGILHVTSDECHELFCDGHLVDMWPETGDPEHWYYRSFRFSLEAGKHTFFAKVWAAGDWAPLAKMGVRPGFLLAAEGSQEVTNLLSTGLAPWEARELPGYRWIRSPVAFDGFTGLKQEIDGRQLDGAAEQGEGAGWSPALVNAPASVPYPVDLGLVRLLAPATAPQGVTETLPPLKCLWAERMGADADLAETPVGAGACDAEVVEACAGLFSENRPMTLPPGQRWRILVHVGPYVRARLKISAIGAGSSIEAAWAESLYSHPASKKDDEKGHRGEFLGKFFRGYADRFLPADEPLPLRPLWWQCGCWIQLDIHSGPAGICLMSLELEVVESPSPGEAAAECSDDRWTTLAPILKRSMTSNTVGGLFVDCPYYEQLTYLEDARLQALVGYTTRADDSIPRKTLAMFAGAVSPGGFVVSRYPCRSRQIIPTFSLLWIEMLHDFSLWRGDTQFVRSLLPSARRIADTVLAHQGADGFLQGLPDWNFVDWADGWSAGYPEGTRSGNSSLVNLLAVRILHRLADLETFCGIPSLAPHWREAAASLFRSTEELCYDASRGSFSDTPGGNTFSLHAQLLAVLSGGMGQAVASDLLDRALANPSLTSPSLFFQHYVFEALFQTGKAGQIWDRFAPWWELSERGLTTTPERGEPTRSDCHAWASHPWFHFFASVLGVRPAGLGNNDLVIRPATAGPDKISARLPWRGEVVDLTLENSSRIRTLSGTLPNGVQAEIVAGDRSEIASGTFDHVL